MCRCVAVSTGSWINEGITHPARAGLKRMTCTMKGMQHSVEGSTAYALKHMRVVFGATAIGTTGIIYSEEHMHVCCNLVYTNVRRQDRVGPVLRRVWCD